MHVQSRSFAFSTLCFSDVLVAVAVLASKIPNFLIFRLCIRLYSKTCWTKAERVD